MPSNSFASNQAEALYKSLRPECVLIRLLEEADEIHGRFFLALDKVANGGRLTASALGEPSRGSDATTRDVEGL
jgi:hypothetical protein